MKKGDILNVTLCLLLSYIICMAQRERIKQEEVYITWWFIALDKNNARVCEALSKLLVEMGFLWWVLKAGILSICFLRRRAEWVRAWKEKGKEYQKVQTSKVILHKNTREFVWCGISIIGESHSVIMLPECFFPNFIVDIHLQETLMLVFWAVPFFVFLLESIIILWCNLKSMGWLFSSCTTEDYLMSN